MKNNIVLIGMPGAGKSTVGVVLAKKMGFDFIDSDLVIQQKTGKKLYQLIDENGVDGFLAIENKINGELIAENCIIATGGSVVYGQQAMEHLSEIGSVVYLHIPKEELEQRLGDLNERGVAMKNGHTLEDLYAERSPLYEKWAEVTVECAGKQIYEIVGEICMKFQ